MQEAKSLRRKVVLDPETQHKWDWHASTNSNSFLRDSSLAKKVRGGGFSLEKNERDDVATIAFFVAKHRS